MQQQENNWRYCVLQQHPASDRLFMIVHNGQSWVFGYEVKQLMEAEAQAVL